MSSMELVKLKKKLRELIDAGYVRPSKAPYGAPILFKKRWMRVQICMCVDHCTLNKVTIKNKYLVPLTQDLMEKLYRASIFTKLDLRSEY